MAEPVTTTLSATRKADRGVMALRLVDLAEDYRLAAWFRAEQPGTRRTSVDVAAGRGLKLTVTFRGRSADPDLFVLSWHGVEPGWRLNPGRFSSVNIYHGHKATDIVRGFTALEALLRLRFAAIADGSAFVANTTAATP